jgi:hypothetical protein
MRKPRLSNRELSVYLTEIGRRGGMASAKKLTPQQRSEKARKAVMARWAKAKHA